MKAGTKEFVVSGVCCATEETLLKKKLDPLLGKGAYSFNLVSCELRVDRGADDRQIIRGLHEAGFEARQKQSVVDHESFWKRQADGAFAVAAMLLTLFGFGLQRVSGFTTVAHGVLLAAIAIGGWKIFLKAVKAVRSRVLDMNVLMSVAVFGALAIEKWEEGAAVIVLFSLSLMLESYSTQRTRKAVQSLMALSPELACTVRHGEEVLVSAREVGVGERVVIRPGDRIPLDGVVEAGTSSVNEAAITGESRSVNKCEGDVVYAGSINERGALTVQVNRRFEETTLALIVRLIEDAQHKRAPVQNFVDRLASIYTPAVLAAGLLTALLPPLVMAEPFGPWLYRALVMIVIACPCALVISTPITIVSALTNAARHGILIKGGKHIETLSHVTAIAFDKTGTLTEGKPRVTDIVPLNSLSGEEALQIIAAMEHRSEHHLAAAVLAEVSRRSIGFAHLSVGDFEALPGMGLKAVVSGHTYYLGNHSLCEKQGYCSPLVERALDRIASEGKTAIVLGKEREAICILALQDSARHQSRRAVDRLRELGVARLLMLSGDHASAAGQIADSVGIEQMSSGLLPDQKVAAVEELIKAHHTVAMVGDGINDAPALAASSVGIAMGVAGSDVALETADVVLMSDDLSKIPYLIGLSRHTMAIIRSNIMIALGVKLLFLILSATGVATLWMAVLADDGAALAVILNGLRVLSLREDA